MTAAPPELGPIASALHPIEGADDDYAALLDRIGKRRLVLLGEASHGTREFYRERARISRALIEHHGFNAIAAEADWPDAYRANCYVRGAGDDRSAVEALGEFRRFPAWMWRNREVVDFLEWLRRHNSERPAGERAGFYGIDLYSLNSSVEAILRYLERIDPQAAERARRRYGCFDHFGGDPQMYGWSASGTPEESCEDEVVAQLVELRRSAGEYARRDGRFPADAQFFAEQNARLVRNAERFYRAMYRGRDESWNLRDSHMAESLDALLGHLTATDGETGGGRPAKAIVWAHNSHLGDARATAMAERGEHNLGQLVRERRGADTELVGFTTYEGEVTAASAWGAEAERKRVRPALEGSYEELFRRLDRDEFIVDLRDRGAVEALGGPRLERAIGVIYRPETERPSHYFDAVLPRQFDAVVHLDRTSAVEPLEPSSRWTAGELPETYPVGV